MIKNSEKRNTKEAETKKADNCYIMRTGNPERCTSPNYPR